MRPQTPALEDGPRTLSRTLATLVFVVSIGCGPFFALFTEPVITRAAKPAPEWSIERALDGTWTRGIAEFLEERSPIQQGARVLFSLLRAHFGVFDHSIVSVERGGWLFVKVGGDSRWAREDFAKKREKRVGVMRKVASRAARSNVRVLAVPVPDRPVIYPELAGPGAFHLEHYDEMLGELAEAEIPVLDLLRRFRAVRARQPAKHIYSIHDTHWAQPGAQLAAEWIVEELVTRGWMPASRPPAEPLVGWSGEKSGLRHDLVDMLALGERGSFAESLLEDEAQSYLVVAGPGLPRPIEFQDPRAHVALASDSFGQLVRLVLAGTLGQSIDARGVIPGKGPLRGLEQTLDSIESGASDARVVVWVFVQRSHIGGGFDSVGD